MPNARALPLEVWDSLIDPRTFVLTELLLLALLFVHLRLRVASQDLSEKTEGWLLGPNHDNTISDCSIRSSYVVATAIAADIGGNNHGLIQPNPAMVPRVGEESRRDVVPNQESPTDRDRPGQGTSWSSQQDGRLLHLRDVAQLTWPKIVTYFPEMSPGSVKSRNYEVTTRRATQQVISKCRRPQKRKLTKAAPPFALPQPQRDQTRRSRVVKPTYTSRRHSTRNQKDTRNHSVSQHNMPTVSLPSEKDAWT